MRPWRNLARLTPLSWGRLMGYYSFISCTLLTTDMRPPEGSPVLPKRVWREKIESAAYTTALAHDVASFLSDIILGSLDTSNISMAGIDESHRRQL